MSVLINTEATGIGETSSGFPQSNLTATTDPTVNDDALDGYVAGSAWYNQTNNKYFICEDATTGAAVWVHESTGVFQPLSSTLTTLASSTAAGLDLMDDATAAAQRTTLGLGTAATQATGAFDAAGAAAAAQAASQPLSTNLTTYSGVAPSANAQTLLGHTFSQMRTDLSLAALALKATIDSSALLDNDVVTYAKIQNVSATDKVLGRSTAAAGDVEEIAFTSTARSLCDDTSTSAMRTTLGLAIGADVQAYDANNTAQGTVIKSVPSPQVFTATGTYTPTTGMLYCIVEAVGGGGGGGAADGALTFGIGGGGGQSGGYSRIRLTAAQIGASKAVAIGAGGAGGTTPGNTGSTGGDTTLGTTLAVAKGGVGGVGSNSTNGSGPGGFNSTTGTGDEAPAGNPGQTGRLVASSLDGAVSGAGGSSRMGPGAPGIISGTTTTGTAAGANTGGGGSGGGAYNTASDAAGGAGGSGKMIIWEFLSA